jgi:hypothetical protein
MAERLTASELVTIINRYGVFLDFYIFETQ